MSPDGEKSAHAARSSRLGNLHGFLTYITQQAVERLDVERVWLFGSRARAKNSSVSDFDLAFSVPVQNRRRWPAFCAVIEENAPTLHSLDLVRMDVIPAELRRSILQEGTLLYDRNEQA